MLRLSSYECCAPHLRSFLLMDSPPNPVLADGLERLRRAFQNSAKPLEAVRQL